MSPSGILIAVSIVVVVQFFSYLETGSFEEYIENIKSVGLEGFLKLFLRLLVINGIIFLVLKIL